MSNRHQSDRRHHFFKFMVGGRILIQTISVALFPTTFSLRMRTASSKWRQISSSHRSDVHVLGGGEGVQFSVHCVKGFYPPPLKTSTSTGSTRAGTPQRTFAWIRPASAATHMAQFNAAFAAKTPDLIASGELRGAHLSRWTY